MSFGLQLGVLMGPVMGAPATKIRFFDVSVNVPLLFGSRTVSRDVLGEYLESF